MKSRTLLVSLLVIPLCQAADRDYIEERWVKALAKSDLNKLRELIADAKREGLVRASDLLTPVENYINGSKKPENLQTIRFLIEEGELNPNTELYFCNMSIGHNMPGCYDKMSVIESAQQEMERAMMDGLLGQDEKEDLLRTLNMSARGIRAARQ